MKILILTQKYPMGNYLLNQRIEEHYKRLGHKVLTLPQIYLSNRGFAQYIGTISNFGPDICYYEMLDQETFNLVSMLKCEKVLVLASLGIFSYLGLEKAVEKLKEMNGKYYTKIYTNSLLLNKIFREVVSTQFFKYYFSPIKENNKKFIKEYNHNIIFLGMGYQRTQKQSREKEIFFNNLKDESSFAIYGAGWTKEQYPCYKGLLPAEDIGKLYSSANSGIAMIQEQQAALGMINNRYIEMMSCGLPIFSLRYKDIDFYEGSEFITFIESKDQIKDYAIRVLNKKSEKIKRSKSFADKMSKEYFEKLDVLMGI